MNPRRNRRIIEVLERRQPDLTVIMERVHKPHNLSAVVRSCDAVGVLDVHAVPAEGGLGGLHRDTSGGSNRWIRLHRHREVTDAIDALHASGHQVVAAHPSDEAVSFREIDYTRPTAVLLGAELDGVSQGALDRVDHTAVIPMAGMVQSLNVSVAAALFLFEAQRQREEAGAYDACRLDSDTFQRLRFEWSWPRLARGFREQGLPYPALDEDGNVLGDVTPVTRPGGD
ncbi:MAG: tRNA (guanosine(18)-2'-O)-methyltransferase TrmH [Gemmatimonadales bacterium]|nr:MAG: tRNA (guanosine(18)-2'-O)-methyltransferase TrmH [Gemmatimonadales bacterium]